MDIEFFPMQEEDWQAVSEIYTDGIKTNNATFETKSPAPKEWDKKLLTACRIVAKNNNKVVAWAALYPVSSRCAYEGVAEVSIYVKDGFQKLGIGRKILNKLIQESEKNNFWTLQAGIFPENEASVKLHKSCGFREVGLREKLGKHHGVWRDVVLLERRSSLIK